MMDREKVNGFELCANGEPCIGEKFMKCPFSPRNNDEQNCGVTMARVVLALLKEQEAKNVVNMTLSKDCFLIASCPKCNALLTRVEHKNYCGYCGQAVKWNE